VLRRQAIASPRFKSAVWNVQTRHHSFSSFPFIDFRVTSGNASDLPGAWEKVYLQFKDASRDLATHRRSSRMIDAASVQPAYRKPFDLIFERAKNEEGSALEDDFRTLIISFDGSGIRD